MAFNQGAVVCSRPPNTKYFNLDKNTPLKLDSTQITVSSLSLKTWSLEFVLLRYLKLSILVTFLNHGIKGSN